LKENPLWWYTVDKETLQKGVPTVKDRIKNVCRRLRRALKTFVRFLFNPHLLLCFGIAWMITNGWGYVAVILGGILDLHWLQMLGGAYLGLLWLPFTPEKVVTLLITIFLLRRLFPKDEKTLGVLFAWYGQVKASYGRYKKRRRRGQKRGEKQDSPE
jgi:hypothetical protein